MLTEPTIKTRAPEPYAARILEVTQSEIAAKAPPLIAVVMDWVKASGGGVAGPPFFNYFEFLPSGRMKMQVGVPTSKLLPASGEFATGSLPDGRYASVTHTGPYADLREASMALDDWVRAQGLAYAGERPGRPPSGATRLEIYRDPGSAVASPVTEVAFRQKD
jgi:effector-binding domain-containing protein